MEILARVKFTGLSKKIEYQILARRNFSDFKKIYIVNYIMSKRGVLLAIKILSGLKSLPINAKIKSSLQFLLIRHILFMTFFSFPSNLFSFTGNSMKMQYFLNHIKMKKNMIDDLTGKSKNEKQICMHTNCFIRMQYLCNIYYITINTVKILKTGTYQMCLFVIK